MGVSSARSLSIKTAVGNYPDVIDFSFFRPSNVENYVSRFSNIEPHLL